MDTHHMIQPEKYHFPKSEYMKQIAKGEKKTSINCELIDGPIVRATHEKNPPHRALLEGLIGYVICILLGVCIALMFTLFALGTETIFEIRQRQMTKYFKGETPDILMAWLFVSGTSLIGVLIAGTLVFFQPSAAGAGMPEVMSYLNGVKVRTYIQWKTLVFKYLSLFLATSSGVLTSEDGPFAHIGTIFAVLFANLFRKMRIFPGYMHTGNSAIDAVSNKKNNLIFGATGAAVGFSVTFRSPLGGAVFALEEAMSHFHPLLIMRTIFSTYISYLVAGYLASLVTNTAVLSPETFSLYHKDADCPLPLNILDIFSYIILGSICGVIGHINNLLYMGILKLRLMYLKTRPYARYLELIVVILLTTSSFVLIPAYFDRCIPLDNMVSHIEARRPLCRTECNTTLSRYLTENPQCYSSICLPRGVKRKYFEEITEKFRDASEKCRENPSFSVPLINTTGLTSEYEWPERLIRDEEKKCYYPLRSLFWTTPEDAIRNIFSRGTYAFIPPESLAIYVATFYTLAVLTYNVMLPTDTIISNFVLGGSLGRLYGILINIIKVRMGMIPVDPGVFAILGAASTWSGATRLMLSVILMSIESTLDLNLLPAIILGVIFATLVGNMLGHGLYHAEIAVRHLPYLPSIPPESLKAVEVRDVMRTDVEVLHEFESRSKILEMLERESNDFNNGFPIVRGTVQSERRRESVDTDKTLNESGDEDDDTSTSGDTVVMKKEKKEPKILVGFVIRSQLKALLQQSLIANSNQADSDVEGKAPEKSEDIPEDMINLNEIMNEPPHDIKHKMSAFKAYDAFRALKLRHLTVVNEEGEIVGMLTRDEFAKFTAH